MELILEFVKEHRLGDWVTFLAIATGLWKFVLKSAFELFLKNRLDQRKQEIGNALAIQKELTLKQAEFEKVKLERALPLLEEVNGTISNHSMMFHTYTTALANRMSYSEKLEGLRLEQDKKIIVSISKAAIYIPEEFRNLLIKIRRVISCSFHDSETMCRVLRDIGNNTEVAFAALDLHTDLVNCFYSMCDKYIGLGKQETSYSEILTAHNLDNEVNTTKTDPINQLAWKFIVLSEAYGSNEIVEAQENYKQFFIDRKSQAEA